MLCEVARSQQCAGSTGETWIPHSRVTDGGKRKRNTVLDIRGVELPEVSGGETGVRAPIVASHWKGAKV